MLVKQKFGRPLEITSGVDRRIHSSNDAFITAAFLPQLGLLSNRLQGFAQTIRSSGATRDLFLASSLPAISPASSDIMLIVRLRSHTTPGPWLAPEEASRGQQHQV